MKKVFKFLKRLAMMEIPKIIIDYATSKGFTGQRVAGTVNNVTYYQLYVVKQKQNVTKPRKIGLPVVVTIKNEEVVVLSASTVMSLMKEISII